MDPVNLLVTLGMLPIVGFGAVWLVQRMVAGDLPALPGLGALALLVIAYVVAITYPEQKMALPVAIVLVVTMAFFPFAESYLETHELGEVETARLEKAHAELSVRPDNIPARFDLARALFDRGLKGHAIGLGENTLAGLGTDRDMMSQRSQRDFYRNEDYMVARWRTETTNPKAFEPVACPLCGTMNPPGPLACVGCEKPYLLELARRSDRRGRVYGRLVVGWILTTGLLITSCVIVTAYKWPTTAYLLLLTLAGVGGTMAWLFRPRTMRG
ncbi:MAG: hypothetical protein JSS66_18480 [Armatimonadetes bacterium]|nr:hypothetical protein [Armatimonadota bacterium]